MPKTNRGKNLSPIKSALILAFILLAGTGLFFWQAGYFSSVKYLCQVDLIFEDLECWEFIEYQTIDWSKENKESEIGIRNYWRLKDVNGEIFLKNRDFKKDYWGYMFFTVRDIEVLKLPITPDWNTH